MKKIAILGAFAVVAFCSCHIGAGHPRSEQDSLAYAVGIDFGSFLKDADLVSLDVNVIAAGIRAALAENTSVMSHDDAQNFMRDYFMIRKPKQAKEESEKFMEKAEKKCNAQKTESGLVYEIVTPGDEAVKPQLTDTVSVVYEGKLKDGKVFDSSAERNDTVKFAVNKVIPGWSEGIQLVGKGGEINLWIPSDLAYGSRGAGRVVGPNEALQFNVKVIDVIPCDSTKLEDEPNNLGEKPEE